MKLTLNEAWAFAHEFFKNPVNQKLSRSNSKRGKNQGLIEGLDYSFIRIRSRLNASASSSETPYKIYRIQEGQKGVRPDMKGTYGRLKRIYDELGQGSYTKIQKANRNSCETEVLELLGHSTGEMITEYGKQYIQMEDLGIPYDTHLRTNRSLSVRTNLQSLIQLCQETYHLHCLGYAHLDIKPPNITIQPNQQVKLIDFGTAKKNPDALVYSSVGTYWYRPRENHQLTGRELDTIAVLRTAYLDRVFQGALELHSFQQYPGAMLSKTMVDWLGLDSILNTDIINRPTLNSFIEKKIDLLALQALLIKRLYKLTLDDQQFINNPRLAYLLTSLWSANISKDNIDDHLINPTPFILSTLGDEFKNYSPFVLEQLFFASHLHPRIDLHQLAQSKKQQFVFERLEQLHLLNHLPAVLSSAALIDIYSQIDTSEDLLKAIAIILKEVPANAANYRESRIQFLLANQTKAQSFHPAIEHALWNRYEYQFPYLPEEIMADKSLALLINCISPYHSLHSGLVKLRNIPGLEEKMIADTMPARFVAYIDLACRDQEEADLRLRLLFKRQDLLVAFAAGMLPKRLNFNFIVHCSEEQCIALRAIFSCHFDLIEDYIDFIEKIFKSSVLHNQCPVENKITILVQSKAKKVELWLHAIAKREQESIALYLPAFNLLTERRAPGHVFDEVISLFLKYSAPENHYALLMLLEHNQMNKQNVKRLIDNKTLRSLIIRFSRMTPFLLNAPGFENYFSRLSTHLYISSECFNIFFNIICPIWNESMSQGPGIHTVARCLEYKIMDTHYYLLGMKDPIYSRLLRTANDRAQFKDAEILAANLSHLLELCSNYGIDNQSINDIMPVLINDDCNYDINYPARASYSSVPLFAKLFRLMAKAKEDVTHSVVKQKLEHIIVQLNKMIPRSTFFFAQPIEAQSHFQEIPHFVRDDVGSYEKNCL